MALGLTEAFLQGDDHVRDALAEGVVGSADSDYAVVMLRNKVANFDYGSFEESFGHSFNQLRGFMMAWLYVRQDKVDVNRELVEALSFFIEARYTKIGSNSRYTEVALDIMKLYWHKTKNQGSTEVMDLFYDWWTKSKRVSELPTWMRVSYIDYQWIPKSMWRSLFNLYEVYGFEADASYVQIWIDMEEERSKK